MLSPTTLAALAATLASSAMGAQFVMYTPGGDDPDVERIDPITNPGGLSAHVHQIFGANNIGSELTYEALQQSDCTTMSSASGDGNAQDKSLYWHPSLFMEAKDGSGYIRVPTNGHKLYYRDVGNAQDKKADPFEFPKGFRMVAGDQTMRAAASDVQRQNITQWICHSSGPWNQGTDGGFPTGVTDCTAYPGFNGAIHFPHCWNGEDFNQDDPSAHITYPDGDVQGGPCPSSHPTRLPHLFLENQFDLHSIVDKVVPDSFVLAQGDKTGYGWHADFFNGWDVGAIPQLMSSCPAPYYGNEDIGTCPTFKKTSIKAADCKLKTIYKEDVTTPGQHLPGCNPIVSTNPAPKMQVAKLGVSTDQCSLKSSSSSDDDSSSSSDDDSSASASGSAPDYSASAAAASSTTFATFASSSSDAAAATAAPVHYITDSNVVWVTNVVTVTARDLPTPEAAAVKARRSRHVAQHIHPKRV